MPHVRADAVISPKAHLQLVKVLIDKGAGDVAYALAKWDDSPCIVFRWNGSDQQPIGNPQSRGLPTWLVLDIALHDVIIERLLAERPDLQAFAHTFLA